MEVLLKRWIVRGSERWTISEVDAREVPGARSDSCLICESDFSVRRLWNYPADWHRIEDTKLLCLFAAPMVKSSPVRARAIGLEVAVER